MNASKLIMTLISSSIIASSVNATPVPFTRDLQLEKEIVSSYSEVAYSNYKDSLEGVKDLKEAVNHFLLAAEQGQPVSELEALMTKAKNIWTKNARVPYGQTEIFRFVNGPVDFESINDGVTTYLESINFEGVEGLMNAWPLDEAYIDSVAGDPAAGIVNDPSIAINKDVLVSMNEQNGEKNISTGYHAIEFLLWGQDTDVNGPGNRAVTDFTMAKNADRRRLYLKTLVEVLEDHLFSVYHQWLPGLTNYRSALAKSDSTSAIKDMFVSMTSMVGDELKSERIENALLLEDQEEEHSCFSDTTVNDILGNYLGVKNIYLGSYAEYNSSDVVSGKGVSNYVAAYFPALDQKIKAQFVATENAIAYFYGTNAKNLDFGKQDITLAFDKAIVSEQTKVQAIVDSLDVLDGLLRQAADKLGYQL